MDAHPFLYSLAIVVAALALNLMISAWMLRQTREGEMLITNWHLDGQPLARGSRKLVAAIWPSLIAITSLSLLLFQYVLGSRDNAMAMIMIAAVFTLIHGLYARAAVRAARRERFTERRAS